MKKLFLIPLMALMCSVMAWGENVAIAQIGTTTYYKGDAADIENHIYATEQAALDATIADVADADTIKLLKSVVGTFTLGNELNKTITLDLNGKTLSNDSVNTVEIHGGSKLVLVNGDTDNDGQITNSSTISILCYSNAELELNNGVNVIGTSAEKNTVKAEQATITINGGIIKYNGNGNPDLIDCNGSTLTMNDGVLENATSRWDVIYIYNNSQVTINGGLITNTSNINSSETQTYAIHLNGNSTGSGDPITTTLNINGGSIVANASQIGYGVTIQGNGATLNMTDGAIIANHFAITGNGTARYGGTTINISGGSLSSATAGAAIYHPQAGTLNITGGTITGQTGIGIKGGTLNISGGTIHAVGSNGGRVEGYNNGLHSSFAAVQIESNPGYAGNMNITVSDNATLISDSWYAFYEYLSNPEGATKVNSIAVTGGHFQGGILLSQSLAAKGGFVSGGKWSKDISANIKTGENLSLLNNTDADAATYPYIVAVPTPAQTADYAEIETASNAVLTNNTSSSAVSEYTSDNVGSNPDIVTSVETNPVVVSENTDVVATEAAPIVEVKKITVDNNAQLTVTEGATLMVGAGSVNLDENATGGGLTVEAGAALVVDGLVYGSTKDNFVIEGEEDKSGIVLFSPETEFIREDHPKATYRFTSKSFRDGSKWVYQRFGMPSVDGNVTVKYAVAGTESSVNSYICTWDYTADDWGAWSVKMPAAGLEYTDAVPFQCYQLGSTNAKANPVTYDFVVDLMGNANAPLHFELGWNPYANSYTAPIDIREFLTDVLANTGADIQATIYLYKDLGNDTYTWQGINLGNVGTTYRVREDGAMVKKTYDATIEPMQAFIMKLSTGSSATTDINYLDNVYNPAMGISRNPESAPARSRATFNSMQIGAYNDLYWDNISVMEGAQFSAADDNGYDAQKYDHNNGLSLYVINGEQHMERVATNNVEGMFIGINAPEAGMYTLDFSGVVGMNYSILDMSTNAVISIVEDGEYNFYANAGQDDYRFQIVAPANMPTAIENVNENVNVKGVYTITGQYLGEDINALPKGVYIINGAKVVK